MRRKRRRTKFIRLVGFDIIQPKIVAGFTLKAKKVALIAAVLVVSWMVCAKVARPYLISYGESREIAEIKQQINQAEAENKVLRHDIRYLSKPTGMEYEARKLGWVRNGEIALVFEKPKKPANAKDQPKDLAIPTTLKR